MKKSFVLLVAILALSACGKSLHVAQKTDGQSNLAGNSNTARTTQPGPGGGSGTTTGGTGGASSTTTGTAAAEDSNGGAVEPVMANPAIPEEPVAQRLGNLSRRDQEELGLEKILLPFGSEGLQFRALHYVADAGTVETVSSIRLVLKDLKLNGSAVVADTDISKLTLCVMEKTAPLCVGGEVPEGFEALNGGFHSLGKTKALPLEAVKDSEGTFQIDLIEAFDLRDKYALEIMRFLEKISVQYDVEGYRKFRLSLGKNAEFSEGTFEIQMTLKSGVEPKAVEVPGKPISPGDDESAVAAQVAPQKGSAEVMLEQSKMEFKKLAPGKHEVNAGKDKLDRTTNLIASYQDSIEKVVIQNEVGSESGSSANAQKVSEIRAKFVQSNLLAKAPTLNGRVEPVGLGKTGKQATRIKIDLKDASKASKLQNELNAIWN